MHLPSLPDDSYGPTFAISYSVYGYTGIDFSAQALVATKALVTDYNSKLNIFNIS